jgi:hypothetical protein
MVCQSLYTNVAFISSSILSQERPKDCLCEILSGTRNSTSCPVHGYPSWKVTWKADSGALPDQGRHSVGYALRGMKRRKHEEPFSIGSYSNGHRESPSIITICTIIVVSLHTSFRYTLVLYREGAKLALKLALSIAFSEIFLQYSQERANRRVSLKMIDL